MRPFKAFVWTNLLWLLLFNSGGISSVDTSTRLWMAHRWWSPSDAIAETPSISIEIDGKQVVPYDLGQPILMLPGDWLGSQIGQRLTQDLYIQQNIRQAVVSYTLFLPINFACVLAGYWMLRLLEFEARTAALSSTLWLLGTTVLQYSVVNQQNNQILLCLMLGISALLAAQKHGREKPLQSLYSALSGISFGAALFIRIGSIAYAGLGGILAIALSLLVPVLSPKAYPSGTKGINLSSAWAAGTSAFLPWLLGFLPCLVLDRWSSAVRFGDWKLTSSAVHWEGLKRSSDITASSLGQEANTFDFLQKLIPSQIEGILGPLFWLEKSIFIYDILLIPGLILLLLTWRKTTVALKLVVLAASGMFLANLLLYSNLKTWGGDAAWGARYHVTPLHVLLLPLIALAVNAGLAREGNRPVKQIFRRFWAGLFVVAIACQVAAISLPDNLEIQQQIAGVGSPFRLGQRFENVAVKLISSSPAHFAGPSEADLSPRIKDVPWKWMPYNYAAKLPDDSGFRAGLPLIFSAWFSLLFLAVYVSFCFWRQLKI